MNVHRTLLCCVVLTAAVVTVPLPSTFAEATRADANDAVIADASLAGGNVKLTPLPPLPVPLAGAFMGSVDGVLVMAGGAMRLPDNGDISEATLSRDVYYLVPARNGQPARWHRSTLRLPEPMAFGASAIGPGELVCIGGRTPDGPTNRVLRLAWVPRNLGEGWFYVDPLTGQWHRVKEGKYNRQGRWMPLPPGADLQEGRTAPTGHLELRTGVQRRNGEYVGLPDLPFAVEGARASVMGSTLYLVGGRASGQDPNGPIQHRGLLRITLPERPRPTPGPLGWLQDAVAEWHRPEGKNPRWQPGSMPAAGESGAEPLHLLLPVTGVRSDAIAERKALWVLGGWRQDGEQRLTYEPTIWRYIPGRGSRSGWTRVGRLPRGLTAASAVPLGHAHLLVLAERNFQPGGSLGSLAFATPSRRLYAYHIYTDTWVNLSGEGQFEGGQLVETPGGFAWVGRQQTTALVTETGEMTDVELGSAHKGELVYDKRYFGWVDFTVIAAYIFGMMCIGWYFSRREKNTDDYFLGGRKIPWWAAGLSMYATGISAISFMAIPAKTFHTDWAYIAQGVFPPIAMVIVAYAFVPLLRRLRITTVMEYYEMRFGRSVRVLGSLQVILSQLLARMSVVVLLPSIALAAVTGWPVWGCIVVMGVLATIYTVLGGISAVIWTDVAQVAVIFGGALLSIFILCANVEGGFSGVIAIGSEFGKFTPAYWDFDLTIASIWVFSIWAINDMFLRLGQENLQRAFSTKDAAGARRSMITMAVVSVPGTAIFYFLGSALFAYYHQHPAEVDPTLGHDSIFPLFIAQKLPFGVAGLVVAGLFAAAMSTLDSGMNTVATIVTRDFFAFFRRRTDEVRRLRAARWITVVTGVAATCMALYLSSFQRGSLWDTFITITAVVGGGFSGVIVLAMLTRRVSTVAMFTGLVVGALFAVALQVNILGYPFKPFVFGTFSLVVTCGVALLMSIPFPNRKDLTGLTVWTSRPADDED
ncbi:MAG: sodium:solute symporter family transporter [Phycisphaerae bacterium]